jgi:hypothetical protein
MTGVGPSAHSCPTKFKLRISVNSHRNYRDDFADTKGTLLGWVRQMAAQKYDSSKKKVGRPRKKKDIRKLVIAMALANLGWGYTKIRGVLPQ